MVEDQKGEFIANLVKAGMDEEQANYSWRSHVKAGEILQQDPSLGITAFIMAQDALSAERASEMLAAGEPPEKAFIQCGSYSRMKWCLENCPTEWLRANLLDLWRGADPDDTDPAFLKMWHDAWVAHGRRLMHDGQPLSPGEHMIYRGQDRGAALGIAWTTDPYIAEKFARGAAVRQGHRDGEILEGRVQMRDVYAFITGRHEQEIVVDPMNIQFADPEVARRSTANDKLVCPNCGTVEHWRASCGLWGK